jgi:phosphoenolpyruvate carboxykinase (ATP)
MKKSVFGLLNYLLPPKGVMPMHCSANIGPKGDTAVFFGLSGTGKTTLSADASRTLIGDDEHGWSDTAVFNFEGGCYAKMIPLGRGRAGDLRDHEAFRHGARECRDGPRDPRTRLRRQQPRREQPRFLSDRLHSECLGQNMGPVPQNIIFLTADAYGVLPPIAKLTPDQAMYHFLSGYTARVAGTEIGVTEPSATFSTCFGAPFMPRHPSVYGNLLKERIAKGGVSAGWSTPAGPAANTAGQAHADQGDARCSTPRSTAA